MRVSRLWGWMILPFMVSMLISCGGDGGSSSSGGGGGTGTASLSLTDATIDGLKALYVTIEEVSVHRDEGEGWEVIAEPGQTYNLLELVNGVREEIGIAELETGHYTQLRMKLRDQPDDEINILSELHPYGNYVIDDFDEYTKLKIPSGYQTGVKVVCGFDVNENQTTELVLDFDASRSIVEAGNSENLLLKPTIKVFELDEYSIISGTVTEEGATEGMGGVLVSAQVYNPIASDPKDEVVIQASTRTDENGSYSIFVAPGTYSVVAYKEGYDPACIEVVVVSDDLRTKDFSLSSAESGTVFGDVTIVEGTGEQHVTFSFRQFVQCDESAEEKWIEVKSVNVANTLNYDAMDYQENLPVGNYLVVASSYGEITQSASIDLIADSDTQLDYPFPP